MRARQHKAGRRKAHRTPVALLIIPAVLCLAATELGPGEEQMRRILEEKNTAIEAADLAYDEAIDHADVEYQKGIHRAEKARARAVEEAKGTAVQRLSRMAGRLAQEGKLAAAITAYKAIYSIDPNHEEAVRVLTAAKVDLNTVPIEPEGPVIDPGWVRADRVVVWNTHNSKYGVSGSEECNIVLVRRMEEVWRKDGVKLPWRKDKDMSARIDLPSVKFDKVRVEITRWKGYCGGLSEVEVWKGRRNLALGRPATASASFDQRCGPMCVTDGITTSRVYKNGYWLLPDNEAGWVQVDFARIRDTASRRFRVFARRPWQRIVKVSRGDVIDITATGTWRAAPLLTAGPDGGQGRGADKWGAFRDRFYLRGRIDRNVFRIGAKHTLKAAEDGVLEMGMQEKQPDWHTNNSGFLIVTLTFRQKAK